MIGYIVLIAIGVLLDQWTKMLVVNHLALGETKPVLDKIFSLFYLQNKGAAWGILEGQRLFFLVITIAVVIVLVYLIYLNRNNGILVNLSYALIAMGAIGNGIDRYRLGYVVDMIQLEFIDFPIFNVADMCLTVGVILLISYFILDEVRAHLG